jgi:hypothetical protein
MESCPPVEGSELGDTLPLAVPLRLIDAEAFAPLEVETDAVATAATL